MPKSNITVKGPLTFDEFQQISQQRSEACWKKRCKDWNIVDWTNAVAGEAGELANAAKKVRRGDMTLGQARRKLLSEASDVIIYALQVMSFLEAPAAKELVRVFNEVSARPKVGFPKLVSK